LRKTFDAGCEYIVDACQCLPGRLASRRTLGAFVDRVVADLGLHPVGEMQWHVFGGPGGITGLLMLSESHLTLHTLPERGYAAFNLYHCASQPAWPWEQRLRDALGAREVVVRTLPRGELREPIHRGADLGVGIVEVRRQADAGVRAIVDDDARRDQRL
jgi:S-adenosylmethionine decarboxylase